MNVQKFRVKWSGVSVGERQAAQEHFTDLCRVLGQPTPVEADPTGSTFAFERATGKAGGGTGFADVWKRGYFAWEYKGNRADLDAAYQQLLQYREYLENPPLLVVSDFERFQIHTNFTGTVKQVHQVTLDEIDDPEALRLLRQVFTDPYRLRPDRTVESVTEDAAEKFGALALSLARRGVEPHRAAHFLVQILFCLFAEDIGLLPNKVFSKLLDFSVRNPGQFPVAFTRLAEAMRDGGYVDFETIAHFNGGLFATIDPEPLTSDELRELRDAAALDWSSIEPAIIGTLFERSLDPGQRSQLGAHYTGRADIERVVDPVVMTPLRRRWDEVRAEADKLKERWEAASTPQTRNNRRQEFANLLTGFKEELTQVRVLDPACGSGNFLYVTLSKLLDLEKEVSNYGALNGLPAMFPEVRPHQLHGLEVNQYAQQLAQVIIWIGYLQWMTGNGFQPQRDPVLGSMETIRLQDALLDRSDCPPHYVKEAEWPAADFIIGNPPFLGAKRIREEIGDSFATDLFNVYGDRLPNFSDLVCYFFEKARGQVESGKTQRVGLLATNSIRGGANRVVLDRIKTSGDIFLAWGDEPWILEGASVRISIVGFDDGTEQDRTLDGESVTEINSALAAGVDLSQSTRLAENSGLAFAGVQPNGPFDISAEFAKQLIAMPINPNGRPNSDVVKPYANAIDITRRPRDVWIIDFGVGMCMENAALYEAPFEHVRATVKPFREKAKSSARDPRWWLTLWSRPAMREAIDPFERYIATPLVSKHRVFVWLDSYVLPSNLLVVLARDDDYFFGVLHSRAHEVWSLRMGTSLEDRPRYTPTTTFETFPFPWAPGSEPVDDPRVVAIAGAAKELDEKRRAWLDPPGASEAELKKRTLTNLYNQRPTWLAQLHDRLDRAVWAAYGWDDPDPATVDEDTILSRLLALNLERSG